MAQCEAMNAQGERCRAPARIGLPWCRTHNPADAIQRAEERRRGGQRSHAASTDPPGEPPPMATPEDVRRIIEAETAAVLGMARSAQRARTVGYLAQVALRCMEVGDLAGRVAELERRLSETVRRVA